jgi:catechol 2,3-dioxygenase-like lactoylglutathione lyase family enzyme
MLGEKDATVTLAVKDLDAAKEFYEGVVGLQPLGFEVPGGALYRSGSTSVLLYESEFAGTTQATAASWNVGDDFEQIVEELRGKGVTFEHYDLPELTLEGDVHVSGESKLVWFKDPDGNILNLAKM